MEITERLETTIQEVLAQEPVVLRYHGTYFVQTRTFYPVYCGVDQCSAGGPRWRDERFDPLSRVEKGLDRNQLCIAGRPAALFGQEERSPRGPLPRLACGCPLLGT
jgi:hypothetical protein